MMPVLDRVKPLRVPKWVSPNLCVLRVACRVSRVACRVRHHSVCDFNGRDAGVVHFSDECVAGREAQQPVGRPEGEGYDLKREHRDQRQHVDAYTESVSQPLLSDDDDDVMWSRHAPMPRRLMTA